MHTSRDGNSRWLFSSKMEISLRYTKLWLWYRSHRASERQCDPGGEINKCCCFGASPSNERHDFTITFSSFFVRSFDVELDNRVIKLYQNMSHLLLQLWKKFFRLTCLSCNSPSCRSRWNSRKFLQHIMLHYYDNTLLRYVYCFFVLLKFSWRCSAVNLNEFSFKTTATAKLAWEALHSYFVCNIFYSHQLQATHFCYL